MRVIYQGLSCSVNRIHFLARRSAIEVWTRRCVGHGYGDLEHVVTAGNSINVYITTISNLNFENRIELSTPCGEGMNLLTCPDFTAEQPYGPAEMPSLTCRWAPRGDCPRCDYDSYDMRRRRILVVRRIGLRFGAGPDSRDPGVDCCYGCLACSVM